MSSIAVFHDSKSTRMPPMRPNVRRPLKLCAESNVVGFELVELLPYRDDGYATVLNSERIVRECLVGITLRKKGIDVKHYLAPNAVVWWS